MSKTLVTAPQNEAATLSFIKQQLNIMFDDDDVLLSAYISVAREHVEGLLSRALITQTWDWSFDTFSDEMCVPLPPLQSVTQISYIDTDGNTQALSASVYDVDIGVTPGVIRIAYDQTWPSIRSTKNAVTVRFVAGYGDNESDVPFRLRQAIALFVGHLYENREATAPITIKTVPMGFDSLIGNYQWSFF